MPNKTADETRAMSDEELARSIDESYRELFNLRLRHANRNLQNPNELRRVRRRIAQLRTIQRQRQLTAAMVPQE